MFSQHFFFVASVVIPFYVELRYTADSLAKNHVFKG
jgi:hypothetical protein